MSSNNEPFRRFTLGTTISSSPLRIQTLALPLTSSILMPKGSAPPGLWSSACQIPGARDVFGGRCLRESRGAASSSEERIMSALEFGDAPA